MSGSAAKVGMTERQQEVLREIAQSRTSAKHLVQRATIVLRAFERIDNRDIACEVGMNTSDVGKWRRRWAKRWRSLILIECQESRAEFKRAVEKALSDEPRSGNPGKFTAEQITLLLANRQRNRAGRSRTGRSPNWSMRRRSGTSWRRSRCRRCGVI